MVEFSNPLPGQEGTVHAFENSSFTDSSNAMYLLQSILEEAQIPA
jgi:hypothetical protein